MLVWLLILMLLQDTAAPMVAWTTGGDLFLWRDGETRLLAGNGVDRVRLAPDEQRVAFTREGALWVVDDTGETMLFDAEAAFEMEGAQFAIDQFEWLDETTLLFNTFFFSEFGGSENDDLYQVDLTSGEVTALAPGGRFTIAPDGESVAVVVPGLYGEDAGSIHILDSGQVFSFDAVATAAEYRFFPRPQWIGTGVFNVAVPGVDMIYAEGDMPLVALWQIDMSGHAERTGAVSTSFFGLPQWSHDGAWLIGTQREGLDKFMLVVAEGDGSDVMAYEMLNEPATVTWVPDSHTFVYAMEDGYWLGAPDADPLLLDGSGMPVGIPKLLPEGMVYAMFVGESMHLRYTTYGGEPVVIAVMERGFPRFDAIP